MKTREYEFEGRKYRWIVNGVFASHEAYGVREVWVPFVPIATPAAASALAALIEDMQVQVIAEWEVGEFHYRGRELADGCIVELRDPEGNYVRVHTLTVAFNVAYEAGKAAR